MQATGCCGDGLDVEIFGKLKFILYSAVYFDSIILALSSAILQTQRSMRDRRPGTRP